jgi:hypothetical protein
MTIISKFPGYIGIGKSAPAGPPDQNTPVTQSPDMKRDAEYIHKKYSIRMSDRILSQLPAGLIGLLTNESRLDIDLSSG